MAWRGKSASQRRDTSLTARMDCSASTGGAHAVEEWVDIDSMLAFTRIIDRMAYEFCAS
jgi:acetylornithine deacetylase/succinyl-diaminopimelate desuccinylase-like protein